ncbi:MAG TPA: hypothetical protein PK435_16070 [Thermoanaerobaculaceae bacterium]|nr:hypothetical protein [Thermoanaerobaculaceae bacterium]
MILVTPWAGDGTQAHPYHPAFADAYPGVAWEDITGQQEPALISTPNAYTTSVECDDAISDTIEADARFAVLLTESILPAAALGA